jgi:adenylate cyclase
LADDLAQPLRIGIGMHCGVAIVGTIGPPRSPNLSAIGDNVNIAARLEAHTKIFDCPLIVSESVAEESRLDLSEFAAHSVDLRGRDAPIAVYAVSDLDRLAVLLSADLNLRALSADSS